MVLVAQPDVFGATVLTLSLLNAMLLGWLALTVLLNAYRRSWGLLVADGALIAGALFFFIQALVAGGGQFRILAAIYSEWPEGWMIGLSFTLAWYLSVLWHVRSMGERPTGRQGGTVVVSAAGQMSAPDGAAVVRRRHRIWLPIVLVLFAGLMVLADVSVPPDLRIGPGRSFVPVYGALTASPRVFGVSLLLLLYPIFLLLGLGLSVDALGHARGAGPIEDLAFRRARPWMLATSGFLALVAALTGAIMFVVGSRGIQIRGDLPDLVTWGDAVVSAAVTVAVLCLGQAIVSYEIFTGKALPRQGLRAQWYGAIFLSVVVSAVAGETVAIERVPFYGLLLAVVLVVVFYALYNWRANVERDRSMEQLRPAFEGPPLFDALLHDGVGLDASAPFAALCESALNAEVAYLVPVGALANLVGPPLGYPSDAAAPPDPAPLVTCCASPGVALLSIDPSAYAGALWALPLWTERGLVGFLFLGQKRGTGLYSREEIEVARASAGRMIDSVACGRMAQRLMQVQRERLAQQRVADHRTRRALHDEALPRLHAIALGLSALQDPARTGFIAELTELHARLSALLRELPTASDEALARLGVVGALRRLVEDEMPETFYRVAWEVEDATEAAFRALPPLSGEVLFYAAREALRNSARHGRGEDPSRPLRLTVSAAHGDGRLGLTIEDDGVGAASSGAWSQGGHGVALHSTMMAVIGGEWVTHSRPGHGTRVTLTVPDA